MEFDEACPLCAEYRNVPTWASPPVQTSGLTHGAPGETEHPDVKRSHAGFLPRLCLLVLILQQKRVEDLP